MKLRILHKGLILLLFPLALQVAFFIQLFGLVSSSEVFAKQEQRFSRFIELSNEMLMLVLKGWASSIASFKFVNTNDSRTVQELGALYPQDIYHRMANLLREAREVQPEGKQGENLLKNIQATTLEQAKLMKQFRAASEQDSKVVRLGVMQALEPKLLAAFEHAFDIQELNEEQRAALDKVHESMTYNRSLIKTQVIAGMAAALVLALALLVFFLKTITARLSLLMKNAELVPLAKPLPCRVPGNDELAYLDDILHRAAADLQRSSEHRKAITQMLAHDLRAPLMSIKLTLDQLPRPETRDSQTTHDNYVAGMNTSLTRLIALIEDLLTIDKLESGKLDLSLDYIDLLPTVQEAVQSLEPQAAAKKIICQVNMQPLNVVADRTRIVQVVTNLLSNAIKYSPEGGVITITSETDADLVRVLVKDQGPGIPESKQESVFDKYFQVENADQGKGFGLGLAICKMIVTRHEGKIGVTSQPGQGCTFWFTLPLDVADDV
jgi:signal transduction histidine kinase